MIYMYCFSTLKQNLQKYLWATFIVTGDIQSSHIYACFDGAAKDVMYIVLSRLSCTY